ncbi:hypothetical protein [Rhodococcus sp. ABRD24]|uniref:hypothetical protein n=1 Tax=Rhodococcus sp. ABRD24 TaxID=2507582 RepID=UPI0013F17629|nr:hypothetical protein [Rhodococcus sp. ABRD24]
MWWLWIALGAWLALAFGAAVLIGRGVRRADREELGSTLDWNHTSIEYEDHPHRRD